MYAIRSYYGTPDAQALAAMLVAQELNSHDKPIYGLYVVGLIWNFIVLKLQIYSETVEKVQKWRF